MTTLTVTSKGQVTLRTDVLRHIGVAKGEKLQVSKLPGGRVEISAARSGSDVDRIFGILSKNEGKRASIAEISSAAAAGWAKLR